jgi:hypothetical protein
MRKGRLARSGRVLATPGGNRAPLNRAGSGTGPRQAGPGNRRRSMPHRLGRRHHGGARAASSATNLGPAAMLDRFEGCGLRVTANRLVFADGNPKPR